MLATLTIFGLFILSIFIRQEKLEAELFPSKEWITAHVLITNHIWETQGGPAAFGFCPIYTFEGRGNKHSTAMGGVKDKDHNAYYVSYPPFAFIFAHYSLKILGGEPLYSIRTLNLLIHFFCAYFIYLIIRKLASNTKDHYSLAGVFGAFLYLFSSGTLWAHSILYFADMLVQLILIIAIYCCIKLIKKDFTKQRNILLIIGLVFFLATYTEWLGLFFSFFTGFAFLIAFILKRESLYFKAFITIGIASSLALSLTIFQYSSIAGFDALVEVSQKKYDIRSGYEAQSISEAGFNIHNSYSFDKLRSDFTRNFLMVVNLIAIFFIILIPLIIWKKTRLKMIGIQLKTLLILTLIVSILAHYLLFFNFNAVHDFSNLKTGLLLILTIGIALELIENAIPFIFKFVLAAILLFFGITRGIRDVKRYHNFYNLADMPLNRIASAKAMLDNSHPSYLAFSNLPELNPEYIYAAKHVPYITKDTNNAAFLLEVFEVDTGQFYYHENDTLKYILEFKLANKHVTVFNRISEF
jgi:hypothetical protein